MNRIDNFPDTETADSACKFLDKAGAVAALLAALIFRRNLDAEWLLLWGSGIIKVGSAEPPTTILEWFTLLQQNQLLGLTLLNIFDLVNYALVGLIFLALLTALKQASQSLRILAAALGFAGVILYFASNQALTMLSLSRQYSAATTGAQREILLAAGQAVMAVHLNGSYAGSGIYLSFLLVSVAGLIISAAMLQSGLFSRSTAYLGLLANGFGLGYYLALAFAPALVFIPLSISAIFLLIWYLRVGGQLWALSSQRTGGALRAACSVCAATSRDQGE